MAATATTTVVMDCRGERHAMVEGENNWINTCSDNTIHGAFEGTAPVMPRNAPAAIQSEERKNNCMRTGISRNHLLSTHKEQSNSKSNQIGCRLD
jgi:hypothetical protein